MKFLDFNFITPFKLVLSGKAKAMGLPTLLGEITILPDHATLYAVLQRGIGWIVLLQEDKKEDFIIEGGFLEVNNNKITILVDEIITDSQIKQVELQNIKKQDITSEVEKLKLLQLSIQERKGKRFYE